MMMMNALVLENPGTQPVAVLKQIAVPNPGPGEVLVRVHAAALNHRDLFWLRGGMMGDHPAFTMGADGAGVVEQVGAGVDDWKQGDEVVINPLLWCGVCPPCLRGDHTHCHKESVVGGPADGTLAEYVRVPATNLVRKPMHLDFMAAAALPLAVGTAWNVLFGNGELKPGETVLLHGIGGGVALFALQIAVQLACKVIVTSGSDEKLERAQKLGAWVGVNYQREDVLARVKELTGGTGVDLVVDGIGKETLQTSFAAAKLATGRIVRFGSVTGAVDIPSRFINKTFRMGGMANHQQFAEAMCFVENARLQPAYEGPFALTEYRAAFELLAQHGQFGKVVLAI